MASIPKKVSERLTAGVRKFQPILTAARARDDNETDTVMVVNDMLQEVFGYDKYTEVTSELAVKSSYCDLAIKLDGTIRALIEVKAVGGTLKDAHTKQAVDYAANKGIDWVCLTNGVCWRVYQVTFGKPIDQELVLDVDFLAVNPRSSTDIGLLYLWCKEAWARSVLGEYRNQRQALNRFFLGATVLSDPVLEVIRRELRRVSPNVRLKTEEIRASLIDEVLKREVTEGEKADEARKKLARAASKALRASESKEVDASVTGAHVEATSASQSGHTSGASTQKTH